MNRLFTLLLFATVACPWPEKPLQASPVDWDAAVTDPGAANLPRPSPQQYAWQEQERTMFVTYGPAAWQGHDYDNLSTRLSAINPEKLDVEQWMKAPDAWGAKQILLVCKHCGGFCWWPTDTTDYGVKNIPWKGGQGNLVKEVIDACRKHGLKLGIYVYSDDPHYTSGIGHGGRTNDPAKQQEWNAKLRQQWREVLTMAGKDLVNEVWFDGGCVVPLDDILKELAPDAVVMNGPFATIRWVGNEEGACKDPDWDTVKKSQLNKTCNTEAQSSPDGDFWMPLECDTTLYDHFWFWSPQHEAHTRKTADRLEQCFVKSVGRGSLFLLNMNPNSDGLIPDGDQKVYQEFGEKLNRDFGHPVGKIEHVAGNEIAVNLNGETPVNCVDLWEDYRYGQRVRKYDVDAWVNNNWQSVSNGTAIGRRKIDIFPTVTTDKLRLRVTSTVGTPLFRQILVQHVDKALETTLDYPPILDETEAKASSEFSPWWFKASYLIDGKMNTRWSASAKDPLAWVQFDLHRPRRFAAMTASELGDRIQQFQIDVRDQADAPWRTIYTGGTVGKAFKCDLPPTTARYIRFHVTQITKDSPTLWEMNFTDRPDAWEQVATLDLPAGNNQFSVDLSRQVAVPQQYQLRIDGAPVTQAVPVFEQRPDPGASLTKLQDGTYSLTRSQAVDTNSSTALLLKVNLTQPARINVLIRPQ